MYRRLIGLLGLIERIRTKDVTSRKSEEDYGGASVGRRLSGDLS